LIHFPPPSLPHTHIFQIPFLLADFYEMPSVFHLKNYNNNKTSECFSMSFKQMKTNNNNNNNNQIVTIIVECWRLV